MTSLNLESRRPQDAVGWVRWFTRSTWRPLLISVLIALVVMVLAAIWVMSPPMAELTSLVRTLGVTSLLSLGIGFLLYRKGLTRSPTIGLTLILSYIWAAALTLFNVWTMAQFMFASEHDFQLAMILLLFAGIIATFFGIFVAATITDSLRQLAHTARQIADGDLSARVAVRGRDEVAQLASAFNRMAQQLQVAARERQELETMRKDLIAWVSHDLRTPLTSIRALIEALHDGVVTDPNTTQRYFTTIRAETLALSKLIDDLFELAQLEAGMELDISQESLADLVSDALERFSTVGLVKNVEVTGDVDYGLETMPLDPSRMSRLLANLLNNAISHAPEGGAVEVHAYRQDDFVHIVVSDNGPGFQPQDLPRIFDQFYRGEPARSRSSGGAGLGLAIARAVAEAHGGRIEADNQTGGGAEVRVVLPAEHDLL